MNGPAPPQSDFAATRAEARGASSDGAASGALSLAFGVVAFNNSAAQLADVARSLSRAIARLAVSETRADPLKAPRVSILLFNNGASPVDPSPFGADAKLTNSSTNLGFGKAHNRLMAEAFGEGADYYLALNPDAMLHPDALIEMIAVARWSASRALVEGAQFPEELIKEFDPLSLDTPWAAGCCLLVPAPIFSATGGFDEQFFLFCEDVDLSWRAREAGFAIKYAPRALVSHSVNRPGYNAVSWQAHLDSGRYLARKWGAQDFQSAIEREMTKLGMTLKPFPQSMPPATHSPYTNFDHWLNFSAERWPYAPAIPVHSVTRRGGLDNTIDIVVRFHDPAQMWRLSRCLFSLYAQRHQPVQLLIVTEGFDAAGAAAVEACVDAFDWSAPRRRPKVIDVAVPPGGDHRARLWNAGLDAAQARYIGFCDFDDVVYAGGYGFLLHRLQQTGAAAAFATSLRSGCTPMGGFDYIFAKESLAARDRYDFFANGSCPPNSALFDRSIVAAADLRADESLSRNADYRAFAVVVAKYETDWAGAGAAIGECFQRSDGSDGERERERSTIETRRFLDTLSTSVSVGDIARLRGEPALRSELEGARAAASAARKEADYERALRKRMKNSLSWRLTSPLREVQRIAAWALSRVRRGG